MDRLLSRLLLYGGLDEDHVLVQIGRVCRDWRGDGGECKNKDALVRRVYRQVRRILDLGAAYGFDGDLWSCYLAWTLITSENVFARVCERADETVWSRVADGSVSRFARNDCDIFLRLLRYDFRPMEQDLQIDCFSVLRDYRAVDSGQERTYNRNAGQQVRELSRALLSAESAEDMFALVTDYYRRYGYGTFALHRAFRLRGTSETHTLDFRPISNIDRVRLSDLYGYESQKQELRRNTEAFLEGKRANNVLLYGDAGTGKSTSVKALINEYFGRGLRMIELYKYQFQELSAVLAKIKKRNYRFILFIDDLSFEENEADYKFLKAVIEGGVETRPENVLIYATSNRRHLIRETWKDKSDMEHQGDIHRSDTVEEKLSLAARFGMGIHFPAPTPKEYQAIVRALALRHGITANEDELARWANAWEIQHGGYSGRTAQQFILDLETRGES